MLLHVALQLLWPHRYTPRRPTRIPLKIVRTTDLHILCIYFQLTYSFDLQLFRRCSQPLSSHCLAGAGPSGPLKPPC